MSAKGQTNWSSEQLEEWAKPALEHPELVEIARTATSNNEAKDEALKWVTKTHENLGQACRWLRILRVKYPERFEKFIKQEEKEMGDTLKELIIEIGNRRLGREFLLPKWTGQISGIEGEKIRFRDCNDALRFCIEILSEVMDIDNPFLPPKEEHRDRVIRAWLAHEFSLPETVGIFENFIIQILEEKFGYKCVAPKDKRGGLGGPEPGQV